MLRDGVEVEYPRPDGSIAGDRVRLLDFDLPGANDWFVVDQFTVIEGQHNRRPDIVVFINGLPLGLIEFTNRLGTRAGKSEGQPRSAENRTRTCTSFDT